MLGEVDHRIECRSAERLGSDGRTERSTYFVHAFGAGRDPDNRKAAWGISMDSLRVDLVFRNRAVGQALFHQRYDQILTEDCDRVVRSIGLQLIERNLKNRVLVRAG